jgi:methylase of polypeptide subunit release factors
VRALGRRSSAAARQALGADTDPAADILRLFLLGDAVDADRLERALPLAAAAPLLTASGATVRAAYDLSPHAADADDWWVVADRTDSTGRPLRRDHVLGVGGASTTLAELTIRRPVARALDIGTGCGVQALNLSTHAVEVTATDAVGRALELAATTFALSGVAVELLEGDLAEPVMEREFDLVVCNPPFVVGPSARYDYRDAGLVGDEMSRRAVRSAAGVLAPGGVAQLLVNWLHVGGEDWRDRVAGWVGELGCDAWLVERDRQVPADYVDTWLDDAAEDQIAAPEWLRWFTANRVDAVGFGWVLLRRTSGAGRVAVDELTHAVDQPSGAAFAAWLDAVEWLRWHRDADLLAACLTANPLARLDVSNGPDAGWHELGRQLRLDGGLRWSLPCDEPTAALVAGCDGRRTLSTVVDVLAMSLGIEAAGRDRDELAAAACSTVRGLVERGLLLPPEATLGNPPAA